MFPPCFAVVQFAPKGLNRLHLPIYITIAAIICLGFSPASFCPQAQVFTHYITYKKLTNDYCHIMNISNESKVASCLFLVPLYHLTYSFCEAIRRTRCYWLSGLDWLAMVPHPAGPDTLEAPYSAPRMCLERGVGVNG